MQLLWVSRVEEPPCDVPRAVDRLDGAATQAPVAVFFMSLAFDVRKQSKADMAYRSGPQTSRTPAATRARPTPAGRKGSDSLGWTARVC